MDYIKSHSNYVLKTKHQRVKEGTIFERDWTTIGGRHNYNENQIPTYDNGNFILTINKDSAPTKKIADTKWVENTNGETSWNYENVKNALNNNESKDNKIVVKSDYFSLQDFAYYGSCSELIRTSLNDVLNRFPGELYITDKQSDPEDNIFKSVANLYYVENPFNIDIYTKYIVEDKIEDVLKYMAANDLTKNYDIITPSNKIISSFTINVIPFEKCTNDNKYKIYECNFSEENLKITVLSVNGKIYYFGNKTGYHIRPKEEFLNDFYKTLDSFESVILNPFTEPKYKASFQIIYETQNGFKNKLEDFIFPIGDGGYNIGSDPQSYNMYVNKFLKISNFYDEHFCDNLYRMMVHESIKNFDWTYKYPSDEKEMYLEGGGKIEKLIRLFGREFDEIKFYIDGVKNYNKVTYDDRSNIPDYFLTDTLDVEGWDVINIYPTVLSSFTECNRVYEDLLTQVTPYTRNGEKKYPYGYYNICDGSKLNDCGCMEYKKQPLTPSDGLYLLDKTCETDPVLRRKIIKYFSEKKYSYKDINSVFFKRLKLNSKDIIRHKGTIEGIEMMLGMFGLKSKRFCEGLNDVKCSPTNCIDNKGCVKYDFDIKEQVSITKGLIDPYFDCKGMNRIDWYNSTKSIQYNNINFVNGIYTSYQGLPVISRKENENNKISNNILYPFFNNNAEYDGNPYYQMNGGWLKQTPYVFDINNNIIMGDDLYTETLHTTKVVTSPFELIEIKYDDLHDGQVCIVNNIQDEYILIDGILYKVYKDYKNNKYISVLINNNCVEIGNLIFNNKIYVSNPYGVCSGNDNNPKVKFYDLSQSENGTEVKLYIYGDTNNEYVIARNDFTPNGSTIDAKTSNQFYVRNGNFSGDYTKTNLTNYFRIKNKDYKIIFNDGGWEQLEETDVEYKRIKSIVNYFKGNNPHNGNLHYDGGFAYMENFANLFQYAVNNEYIDYRQYQGTYYKELEYIDKIGFKHLINEDSNTYKTYNDSKIHYFGDYINLNKNAKDSDDNKDYVLDSENTYTLNSNTQKLDAILEYDINAKYNDNKWFGYEHDYYYSMFGELNKEKQYVIDDIVDAPIDSSTNQIVNTKIVNITFYLYPSTATTIYDKLVINEIKYYQSVIIPYLTQMIPSTVILTVDFQLNCNIGGYSNECDITNIKIIS